MKINHNIAAMTANNHLSKTNKALDKSLEKLSTGFKINKAADDAAGMAISQKMKTQIAALDRASQNAADGISVIQTAEGALSEVESILQRMRELSVQAANGTNTLEDRKSIQAEINQLNAEIQRISDTTEFNTKTLLDGNIDQQSYSDNSLVQLISLSDTVQHKDYNLSIECDPRQAVLVGAAIPDVDAVITGAQAGVININGVEIEVKQGESVSEVYEKIRETCDTLNINVFSSDKSADPNAYERAGYKATPLTDTNSLIFVSKEYGSRAEISIVCEDTDLCQVLGLSTSAKAQGIDAQVDIDRINSFNPTATYTCKGNILTVTDSNSFEMVFEIFPGTSGTTYTDATITGTTTYTQTGTPTLSAAQPVKVTVLNAGPMELQIGANEGQGMSVKIPAMNPKTLGTEDINVCSEQGAQKAIAALDFAIEKVSATRAQLGAYQNRLEHSIANLDTTSENMSEALSRIEDVDMAEEMANYTQKQVLSQAGTSMLAQANERPQTILSLLQG